MAEISILTQYEFNDFVTLKGDEICICRQIIGIQAFVDGSYQYLVSWYDGDGQKNSCYIFESEIKEKVETFV